MSGILSSVDQRTKLAGENRLELLLFGLGGKQLYGINVFKVKEIVEYLPLTAIPQSSDIVSGIVNMRGQTFPVFDLSYAIGYEHCQDPENAYIIITEYNQTIQGFLVNKVNRIINLDWGAMHKPPPGAGKDSFLTAITDIDGELVEIIDVEKILQMVSPASVDVSQDLKEQTEKMSIKDMKALICDDSMVARKQVERTLRQIGLQVVAKSDGIEAYNQLVEWTQETGELPKDLLLLISDIEMPEMDGYKLTTEIRNNPKLAPLYVILHSSLTGVFNNALVEKVGADDFIPKFDPDTIVTGVKKFLDSKNIEMPDDIGGDATSKSE